MAALTSMNFVASSVRTPVVMRAHTARILSLGQNLAGGASSSSLESASYGAAGAGYESSAVSNGLAGAAGSYESSSFSTSGELSGGLAVAETADANQSSFESSSSVTQVQQYAIDAQGLFRDPDPQIIRRPATGGVQTYTQNIKIRFLQPPPIPPPGVCHIEFIA